MKNTVQYPSYDPQPYTGNLLSMVDAGPSDARYSSGTAPRYEAPFDRRYGRRLAGTDLDVSDESTDPGYASNELDVMSEMDDVQGNGVFDPPGTHPNIHPDAGVLAARYSLPGYHAREVPFAKSEVVDATTGRRVIGVPSGAVSLDSAAQIAFIEQGRYRTPKPVVNWQEASPMPGVSIANWMQDPQTVPRNSATWDGTSGLRGMRGFGDTPTAAAPVPTNTAGILGKVLLVGLAAGAIYGLTRGKKKR
jgi:hypothetical protein